VLWNPLRSYEQDCRVGELLLTEAVINDDLHKCLTSFYLGNLAGNSYPAVDWYWRRIIHIEIGGEYAGTDSDKRGRALLSSTLAPALSAAAGTAAD